VRSTITAAGGQGAVKLKLCSLCGSVYYCSAACQAAAWEGGHSAACKALRASKMAELRARDEGLAAAAAAAAAAGAAAEAARAALEQQLAAKQQRIDALLREVAQLRDQADELVLAEVQQGSPGVEAARNLFRTAMNYRHDVFSTNLKQVKATRRPPTVHKASGFGRILHMIIHLAK
jgi:chromosome segregation ATPase